MQGRNRHRHSIERHGFTLIELLVIVAILAILAGMIAPVFASGRDRVRSFVCLSNMRQLGVSTSLYTQDYDEQFPAPNSAPHQWLPDLHQPYLKQWKTWLCPGDTKAKLWDGKWGSESFRLRTSYIWNAYVFQGDAADWNRSISLPQVNYPSTLVLWAEGFANAGWVNEATPLSLPDPGYAYIHNAYGDNLNAAKSDPSARACPIYNGSAQDLRHTEGGNYAFADGHSRWLKPRAFTTRALIESRGDIIDDRTDPLVTNGSRFHAGGASCPVFCCPRDIGTPPGDGEHPWFRP